MIPRIAQKKPMPTDRLFKLFQFEILTVSAQLGLLGNVGNMNVAGDGTPIVSESRARSKPNCNCRAQGIAKCEHGRIYSQPDCYRGWNSSREKYFNGYHLYNINTCDSSYNLPLYPRLNS